MWLSPDRFELAAGEVLTVRQLLEEHLSSHSLTGGTATEVALLRRMTPRFDLITQDGTIDLLRELPEEKIRPVIKPVLERIVDFRGLGLVVMNHDFIHTEHSNDNFRHYLEHESLDPAAWQEIIDRKPRQSERYARFFKTLVKAGPFGDSDVYRRNAGQPLEIVLSNNPYELGPGDPLEIEIYFEHQPLSGARVSAINTSDSDDIHNETQLTDSAGKAKFTLELRGMWMLRVVHLRLCGKLGDGVECGGADWESYWATFTFKLD